MFPGLLEILFRRRKGSIFTPLYKFLVALGMFAMIVFLLIVGAIAHILGW